MNMHPKPYCVGDVTTNRIIGRYETLAAASKAAEENPSDLLAFHESHKINLGMTEDDAAREFIYQDSGRY